MRLTKCLSSETYIFCHNPQYVFYLVYFQNLSHKVFSHRKSPYCKIHVILVYFYSFFFVLYLSFQTFSIFFEGPNKFWLLDFPFILSPSITLKITSKMIIIKYASLKTIRFSWNFHFHSALAAYLLSTPCDLTLVITEF